jgi:hypothetical protein
MSGRDEGQMVVEMAVVAPVMIVMALVVFNLMSYVEAVARFDRVAPDAVLAVGVSPAGGGSSAADDVAAALERAMAGVRGVSVTVELQTVWDDVGTGLGFTFAPHLTRFVCTMSYEPWPSSIAIAGIDASPPLRLAHERSFVVDRYKTAVVV